MSDEVGSFERVFRQHHGFVWRSLARHGVRPADLCDACQDVFLVVHRRLPELECPAALRTWLGRLGYNHFPQAGEMVIKKDHAFSERLLRHHIAHATPLK